MLALKIGLLLIAGILNVICSLLVLARDMRKVNNLSFFGLAFSIGGWTLGIAAFLATHGSGAAFNWAKVYYFFPLGIALSIVIFAKSFPDRKVSLRWMLPAFIGFFALALPLVFDHSFVTERLVYHDWGKEIVLNKVHYMFYGLYLLICFPLALGIIYRQAKKLSGLYSSQANLFFTGFTIASFFGVIFNLILPWFGNYKLIWIGPAFTSAFIISIALSIVRHKMFDIRLVIARSLGYAGTLLVLSAIYGFIVLGSAQLIFKLHFSLSAIVFLSIATGVASITWQSLRKRFDRATNSLFYRDAYDPQALLDQLNKVFVSTTDIDRLLHDSTQLIGQSVKAEFCLIGLRTSDEDGQRIVGTTKPAFSNKDIRYVRQRTPKFHSTVIATDYLGSEHADIAEVLRRNGIDVLVRLSSNVMDEQEGLGYLILGTKRSGNPYTTADFRVLDTIAKELIIAIQNALRFEEIQNFNVTLQQRIEEATHKLRNANKRLTELDETKDDFISMASHQLRTPLTSVKGYLSLVLEGDAGTISPMQRKLLSQAFTSSQRMVYLIADLLNVSRLKTGKFVIEAVPSNLADVVQEEIAQLKETLDSHSLKLVYNKPAHFPDLMLDETKTRQVVMNFIDNAIYYTPAGGTITVNLKDKPAAIELTVVDNGIGVPKAEQHHLFTKFYRANNARKTRPDGTGLGLFMAKKVILAQGGAVIFESAEGKGSTFGFTLSKSKLGVPAGTNGSATTGIAKSLAKV